MVLKQFLKAASSTLNHNHNYNYRTNKTGGSLNQNKNLFLKNKSTVVP